MQRPTKSTEYLRHTFTQDERLKMGEQLAQCYNTLAAISDEEKVMKSKFAERKTTTEQSVRSLSQDLATGWTMTNVPCLLKWGSPNANEVEYVREDTNEVIRTRAMTPEELQEDLPFNEQVQADSEAQASALRSAANIEGFFKGPNQNDEEEEPDPDEEPGEGDEGDEEAEFATAAAPAQKSGPAELKAFHEKEAEKESKKGRKKAHAEPF